MVRTVGILGVSLVVYGAAVSVTRMQIVSMAITAAFAGVGMAWAAFGE